ncbi:MULTISPECIES: precorrin-6y C5,15-methyltransferase (decarboxylating) subunit CbiE [unclassified Luteococcus]|uniref:precorrin-6y C5,15-methyltransferase (decarboxylating) subunit CbiE n=1 Tax=unclassified Luteococcus TaxID=2639923 RepID=UPI00313C77C6
MIRVYGYLGEPSLRVYCEAAAADLVVGGARHLDALDVPEERRIVLGPMSQAIPKIVEAGPTAQVLVVASGDPGMFGIVRRLTEAGLSVQVVPRPTSIAEAFARVGMAWDDAEVVSVHGRPLTPGLAVCRAWGKVAVMTSPVHGLRELAAGLADLDRRLVLCERLGEPDERVREFDVVSALQVDEILEPNVVLVLDPAETGHVGWRLGAPRPEGAPPAVSPAAAELFCRLLPGLGDLLWVRGELAREVAGLARTYRSAVIDLAAEPAPVAAPTWLITDDPADAALAAEHGLAADRVVLTTGMGPTA